MKNKQRYYTVRWGQYGKPSIANVGITALNDANAKKQADSIAIKLNVQNTLRTIYEGNRVVEWK